MATLEKIRGMKYLLIGFVGFALVAFIIGDLFQGISSFQDDPNVMVKVGDEEISANDFQEPFERTLENLRQQSPDGTVPDMYENYYRNEIINSLIQSKLLDIATGKIGLNVGQEELTDLFVGNNISPVVANYFRDPNTGAINREAIANYVTYMQENDWDTEDPQMYEANKMWNDLKEQVVQQQIYSKFSSLLANSVAYNKLDAQAELEKNKVKVDFDYAFKPYSSISNEGIEVTDAEIQKLYDKKKNQYKIEDTRVVDYIQVNVAPSQKDIEAERAKLEEVRGQMEAGNNLAGLISHNSNVAYKAGFRSYNRLTAEEKRFVDAAEVGSVSGLNQSGVNFNLHKYEAKTVAPDSVTFSIIPVRVANTLDEAVVTAKADSLLNVLKATPFADVARVEMGGQGDGTFGTFTEQDLLEVENRFFDESFKNAVFNAPLNQAIVVPMGVKGTFIVQVTEKTQPVDKYKVATITKEVRASKETRNDTYNKLSRYISTNADLQAFRDSALAYGYMVYPDMPLTKQSTGLGSTPDTRQVVQWAFGAKNGQISKIYETSDYNSLVVAALRNSYPKGIQPLALVKPTLERELINEKKAAKLQADLQGKSFSTIDECAAAMDVTKRSVQEVSFGMTSPISGINNEPIIYAEAPNAPKGSLVGPLAGKNGVYYIYVTDKRVDENTNEEAMKQQATQQAATRAQQMMRDPELLKGNIVIEDKSINFPAYR